MISCNAHGSLTTNSMLLLCIMKKKQKKQQVIMVHFFGQHAISMPSTTHWCKWELPVQSVHITTDVVSSNPTNSEVYSIQHYMIKFVSDLRHVRVFSGYSVSSINKTDCHNNWNTVESGVKHHKPTIISIECY